MNKTVLATALVSFLTLGTVPAPAWAKPLIQFTPERFQEIYYSPDPIMVLLAGDGCTDCAAVEKLLEQHSSKYPQFKYAKRNMASQIPADQLPQVTVLVRGSDDVTFHREMIGSDSASIDAFLKARTHYLAKRTQLIARLNTASEAEQKKRAPFTAALESIDREEHKASTPEYQALSDAREAVVHAPDESTRRTALAQYGEKLLAYEAKIAPYRTLTEALRTQVDAIAHYETSQYKEVSAAYAALEAAERKASGMPEPDPDSVRPLAK